MMSDSNQSSRGGGGSSAKNAPNSNNSKESKDRNKSSYKKDFTKNKNSTTNSNSVKNSNISKNSNITTSTSSNSVKNSVNERVDSSSRLSRVKSESFSSGNVCVVCYKDIKFHSVGQCDHHTCFECSVRMRALLAQNSCPICRQPLEKVAISVEKCSWEILNPLLRRFVFLPNFGIYLENEEINKAFDELLEHKCTLCPNEPLFKEFNELKNHVARTHDLFPCDLCVQHIKQFSKERKFYTRSDLGTHKRKGDKNDTSHRGHPLCQFCDKRYFDPDELFKHLRKDHYFCHFCDADGLNQYYNAYDDLRLHFRKEHFLCEEENCVDEKFTSVFRSEIDLKSHLASAHSRLLGKQGMRAARMLDVEFSLPQRAENVRGRFGGERRNRNLTQNGTQNSNVSVISSSENSSSGVGSGSGERVESEVEFVPSSRPKIDPSSVQDFPDLLGGTNSGPFPPVGTESEGNGLRGGGSSLSQKLALRTGRNVSHMESGSSGSQPKWHAKGRREDDFPALSQPPSSKTTQNSTKQVSNSAKDRNKNDFPSLPSGSSWTGPPKLVEKNPSSKTSKIAPYPLEEEFSNYVPLVPHSKKNKNNASSTTSSNVVTTNVTNFNNSSSNVSNVTKSSKTEEFPSLPPQSKPSRSGVSKGKKGFNKEKNVMPPQRKISPPPGFRLKKEEEEEDEGVEMMKNTMRNEQITKNSSASSKPPPGFENFKPQKPPPGVELNLAKTDFELYSQPQGFEERVERLNESIERSVGTSFELYSSIYGEFRRGEISTFNFYELARDILGMTDFSKLVNEIVALLPDIQKQRELYAEHRKNDGRNLDELTICHICEQVLKNNDVFYHMKSHQLSYPSLSSKN